MVWFHPTDDMQAGTVGNQLRPEVLESLFYMWRFTGDVRYRYQHLNTCNTCDGCLAMGKVKIFVHFLDKNKVPLIISTGAKRCDYQQH